MISRPLLPAFAVLLLAAGATPAAAVPTCPESCIQVPGPEPDCTTQPARFRAANGGHGTGGGEGAYNLPAGTAEASGSGDGSYGAGAIVTARDDFRVTGLPDGTPLNFTATYDVVFSGANQAFFDASLQDGAAPAATVTGCTCGQPTYGAVHQLTRTLTHPAGEVFRLTYRVYAGCNGFGGASATGTLRFIGLPPGARVESCQGYVQDFAVPAQLASWGAVKSRYR